MLMKGSSKRKRTKEQLEEVKQEEEAMRGDIQGYLQDVKRLKQELNNVSLNRACSLSAELSMSYHYLLN